jgi:hypothetical protein
MSEYKKRIAVFAVVAVLATAGLAVAVNTLSLGGKTSTTTPGYTTSMATSQMSPPEQNDFTLNGPVPLIVIMSQNNTFALTYSATTLSVPVTGLSFALNQSYITTYSNGTKWVPYSQACSSNSVSSTESVPSQSSYSVTVITQTANSCGYPAPLGWAPVNGSAVESYQEPNSNQIQLSVVPTAIAANQTVSLRFTITLNLPPGVYDIGLGLGVHTSQFFEYSHLNPFPVVVK